MPCWSAAAWASSSSQCRGFEVRLPRRQHHDRVCANAMVGSPDNGFAQRKRLGAKKYSSVQVSTVPAFRSIGRWTAFWGPRSCSVRMENAKRLLALRTSEITGSQFYIEGVGTVHRSCSYSTVVLVPAVGSSRSLRGSSRSMRLAL